MTKVTSVSPHKHKISRYIVSGLLLTIKRDEYYVLTNMFSSLRFYGLQFLQGL